MQGFGRRMDPFQRMTGLATPDTMDSLCNVFAAYRSMIFQIARTGVSHDMCVCTSKLCCQCHADYQLPLEEGFYAVAGVPLSHIKQFQKSGKVPKSNAWNRGVPETRQTLGVC